MRSVLLLAAAALLLSATSFAAPAEQPVSLADLETATEARIVAIDALVTTTKHEQAERKWLTKASSALMLYQGVNDKADLKKGLAKAASCLRRSKCDEPFVTSAFPALRDTLTDIAESLRADAASKLVQLTKAKQRKTVERLIGQAEKTGAKAAVKWDERMDKSATLYVTSILKFRSAIERARTYGAIDTQPIDIDSSALTLVLDPTGRPLANALVGGARHTNRDGVAVGEVGVSPAGWISVSSPGFATGYATSIATVGESDFYTARLTPFDGQVPLDAGESKLLQVGDETGAWAEVTVDASQLAVIPATVGLTRVSSLDVGPLFEPVPGYSDHWLRLAFALQAWSSDGADVGLASGDLDVAIDDQGSLSDAPVLARFDPSTGAWVVIPGACARVDASHVSCTLPRFAALFGLFEPGVIAYGKPSKTGDEVDLEFRIALAELGFEIRLIVDQGGVPAHAQAVLGALNALADVARESVDVSATETAKFHLLTAAGAARSLEQTSLSDALTAEALELAELFATALAGGDPCSDGPQMIAAVAQLDALGGSASLIASLATLLHAGEGACDERWAGTVSFLMPIDKVHPGLDDFVAFVPAPWRETYWVDFTVNTKTHSLQGTCTSSLSMGIVMYLDETEECLNYIRFRGEPSAGQVEMGFTGSFDGSTFAIGSLAQTGGATITISQRQHFETKKDDQCQQIVDITYPFPNHAGFLAHGMYQPLPMVALDALLNTGARVGGDGRVSASSGNSGFVNPIPESGKYPFSIADVTWSFTRID